jgi:hypothetical protein
MGIEYIRNNDIDESLLQISESKIAQSSALKTLEEALKHSTEVVS